MRFKYSGADFKVTPAVRILIAVIFLAVAVFMLADAVAAASSHTTYLITCSSHKPAGVLFCEITNGILKAIPENARWLLSGVGGTISAVVFLYAAFLLFSSAMRSRRAS